MKLYQLMRAYNAKSSSAPINIFGAGTDNRYPSRSTITELTKKDGCELSNRIVKSFSFEYGTFRIHLKPEPKRA